MSEHTFDFQATWETLEQSNSRGWCEMSVDNVVRILQALQLRLRVISTEEPPFQGELVFSSPWWPTLIASAGSQGDLKIVVSGSGDSAVALLRLRESDDDESCLWRLRCEDEQFRVKISRSLAEWDPVIWKHFEIDAVQIELIGRRWTPNSLCICSWSSDVRCMWALNYLSSEQPAPLIVATMMLGTPFVLLANTLQQPWFVFWILSL